MCTTLYDESVAVHNVGDGDEATGESSIEWFGLELLQRSCRASSTFRQD